MAGTKDKINIRPLAVTDHKEVVTVARIHENIPSQWVKDYEVHPQRLMDRIIELSGVQADDRRCCLVAENETREIVGFHWLELGTEDNESVVHIRSLWVAPEFRRRGIAQALKLAGEKWAKKHGAVAVITNVHTTNTPMLKLNRSMGFEPEFLQLRKKL